jgi:predicted DNA binding CopG/RHH family protein
MARRRNYQELGEIELPADVAARASAAVEQAERDLLETEVRINFRWGASQLALVKRAAELSGVPYQSYLKQVLYRQATSDLRDAAQATSIDEEFSDDQKSPPRLRLVRNSG